MSSASPFVAWLGCLPLILASCTGEEAAPAPAPADAESPSTADDPSSVPDARRVQDTASASSHIAALIPADSAVYVQLESVANFDLLIDRLARANVALGLSFDELGRMLHRSLPGDERYLESDRPVGIAISLPPDREPEVTLVLPIKDIVLYRRSLQISPHAVQPVFDGTYLAISDARGYERPREPVALALGECTASVVARADVAKLDRRFGSQLRLALAALATGEDSARLRVPGDPALVALLQELADPLLYALAVGQQAELTCEIEDGRLQVHGALETRDAGVLAAWTSTAPVDLRPFSRSLVASDTWSFLAGSDPAVAAERLAGLLTETDTSRERLARLLASFTDLFGSVGAISASLTSGSSHLALHVGAGADPAFAKSLASTFELFSRSGLGVVVKSKNSVAIEGAEVEELLVHFDAASMCLLTGERAEDLLAVQSRLDGVATAMFGAESVRVRIASFGERGLIAIGNDEAWFRRTLLWAKEDRDLSPPDVRAALEHLGAAPAAAIVRLDVARWMQDHEDWRDQWRALSEPVRNLLAPGATSTHALDPQPLTLHLGAEGKTLRIGVSMGLDVGAGVKTVRR